MKRLLFLKLGPYFMPDELPNKEKYLRLSSFYEGDIISVVNRKEFRHFNIRNFNLKGLYLPQRIRYMNLIRNLLYTLFTISTSVYSHYFRKKYDAIVAYDPITTGLVAIIIGKLTGARIIVEINGNYLSPINWDLESGGTISLLKYKFCKIVIPFTITHVHGVKLLYKDQIKMLQNEVKFSDKIYCFHSLVPISQLKEGKETSKYILFLGTPWYRKGVDILIKAFNKIYKDFPGYTLKIVGYLSDKAYLEELSQGNDNIEFCNPVWHDEAMELLSKCFSFILPSRSEAMGRVLLEAMASKKPIIASNVDGIPTYIKHGYNGLLFESENVDDLAEKMRMIMGNESYAKQLAENGYKYVHEHLSEECYVNKFHDMIEKTLNDK